MTIKVVYNNFVIFLIKTSNNMGTGSRYLRKNG